MAKFRTGDALSMPQAETTPAPFQEPNARGFDHDANPFAVAARGEIAPQLEAPPRSGTDVASHSAEKHQEDDVALPTPIAALRPLGEVIVDGRREPIYKPIPGFEHLFTSQEASRAASSSHSGSPESSARVTGSQAETRRPGRSQQQQQQRRRSSSSAHKTTAPNRRKRTAEAQSTRTARKSPAKKAPTPKRKTLKRSRDALERSSYDSAQEEDDDSYGDDEDDEDLQVKKEVSFTLYIGDIDKYKHFLRTRFLELTLKPLRGIVTEWIKELEPHRLSTYGPYTRELPTESGNAPPWWPRDIIYNEPSHLKKDALIPLAIEIMLLHRPIDERKRRHCWIDRLRQRAMYQVKMTPVEHFSSSDTPEHSEMMRDRALNILLPNLFDVAQSHEDHLAMYGLYEDLGSKDPGCGKYVQWQRIPMPPRPQSQRKRARPNSGRASARKARYEPDVELSEDETEPDDEMNVVNSCNASFNHEEDRIRDSPAFSPSVAASTTTQPPALVAEPVSLSTQPQPSSLVVETTSLPAQRRPSSHEAEPAPVTADRQPPDTTSVLGNQQGAFSTAQGPISSPSSSFDQSMNRLCLAESDTSNGKAGAVFHITQQYPTMNQDYGHFSYHQNVEGPSPSYPGQEQYMGNGHMAMSPFVDPGRYPVFSPGYHQHMGRPPYGHIAGPSMEGCQYGFVGQQYQPMAPTVVVLDQDPKAPLQAMSPEYHSHHPQHQARPYQIIPPNGLVETSDAKPSLQHMSPEYHLQGRPYHSMPPHAAIETPDMRHPIQAIPTEYHPQGRPFHSIPAHVVMEAPDAKPSLQTISSEYHPGNHGPQHH